MRISTSPPSLQLSASRVFGLSTQKKAYQQEAVARLHLPFLFLRDEQLRLTTALSLPTFEVDGMTLIKGLPLVIDDGEIEIVLYPDFPPDADATIVAAWLRELRAWRPYPWCQGIQLASATSTTTTFACPPCGA